MQLLLVDDDVDLSDALAGALRIRGYGVDVARTGAEAAQCLAQASYSAAVVDLGLPDIDGIELIGRFRADHVDVPVLILTARDRLDDRVAGLSAGADDCLLKPFQLDELLVRIDAIVRRGAACDGMVQFANLQFAPTSGDLWIDGSVVELTRRESEIARFILRRPGMVVPKTLLDNLLFDRGETFSPNAIEVYVHRLRKKLAGAGAEAQIETVRGVGYLLRPVSEVESRA